MRMAGSGRLCRAKQIALRDALTGSLVRGDDACVGGFTVPDTDAEEPQGPPASCWMSSS